MKAFAEQTALITGGATGIGRSFTEVLLENGMGNIVIASRRQEVVDKAADELNEKFGEGRVLPYSFDLRDRNSTKKLVEFSLPAFPMEVDIEILIWVCFFTTIIAVSSVILQTVKAAVASPVDALRYE